MSLNLKIPYAYHRKMPEPGTTVVDEQSRCQRRIMSELFQDNTYEICTS
jgi:hypothetical protein